MAKKKPSPIKAKKNLEESPPQELVIPVAKVPEGSHAKVRISAFDDEPWDNGALLAGQEAIESLKAARKQKPGIDQPAEKALPSLDLTSGILVLNGRPISLEANELTVLEVLVNKSAATLQSLRNKSGCSSPNKVLNALRRKYPALKRHIFLPGKKGRGGYSTTIQVAK